MNGVGRDIGGEGDRDRAGADKLGEGGGPGKGVFRGGVYDRINHVEGGVPDTQVVRGLLQHNPCGVYVEGIGSDY